MKELPNITLNSNEKRNLDNNKIMNLNFVSTNARSLLPKVWSLYDYFEELDLSFAMITETWLCEGTKLDELVQEIRLGRGLDILYKNRANDIGESKNGGGVAILYNPSKISLKLYPTKRTKHEIICAVGRPKNSKRKLAIINAYLPPKQNATMQKNALKYIGEAVEKMKKEMGSPTIVVSGDFNRQKKWKSSQNQRKSSLTRRGLE